MKVLAVTLACCMTSFVVPAWSQSNLPGLWEITSKLGGNSQKQVQTLQMQELVAKMSSEDRTMVEGILAQQGIKIGTGPDAGAMVVQTCITPEMVAHNRLMVGQQGDCTSKTSERTVSGMLISFKCVNPTSSGKGKVRFSAATDYSMTMRIKTTASGALETMTLEGHGKWLSAECGTIYPQSATQK